MLDLRKNIKQRNYVKKYITPRFGLNEHLIIFKHLHFMNNSFIRLENLYEFTALYVWYTREKFKILRKF